MGGSTTILWTKEVQVHTRVVDLFIFEKKRKILRRLGIPIAVDYMVSMTLQKGLVRVFLRVEIG